MQASCPQCQQMVRFPETMAGQVATCPKCKTQFQLPTSDLPQLAPPSEPTYSYAAAAPNPLPTFAPSQPSETPPASSARKWREPTSIVDIFDWRLETYLTPWILRASWIMGLFLAALWLLGACWELFTDMFGINTFSSGSPWEPRPTSSLPDWAYPLIIRVAMIIRFFFYGMIAVLGLLWLRVALEFVIVIFNIAETAKSIEQKLEERPR